MESKQIMKLVRFGERGSEKPGLIDPDGGMRDLSDYFSDFSHEGISLSIIEKSSPFPYHI